MTIRVDESRNAKEQQDLFNDISNYAESQTQRLYNLQPIESKRQGLEFVAQQSRQLDAILNDKENDKSIFFAPFHQQEINTLSCQLNVVQLIDRSPTDDTNVKLEKAVSKAQKFQDKRKKKVDVTKKENIEEQEEEHSPLAAVKSQ